MAISLSSGGWMLVAGAVAAFCCASASRAFAQSCQGDTIAVESVRTIVDGRTLMLESGRIVRLAGVALPARGTDSQASPAPDEAHRYLQATLEGRKVVVKSQGLATDRHGRLPAFIFVPPAVASQHLEASVQHAMLERGLVRVAPRAGDRACATSLLLRERKAREARLGLWADPQHAVQQADDAAAVLTKRGKLALVEGRVQSVRESGGTIYVNFGRRWAEDFTVTIAKRNERMLAAGGLDAKRLERRSVRVRGYVEERGGPWIEVTRPEQIEVTQ